MPRKAFIAHIKEALEHSPKGLSGVSKGEDDGDLNVTYTPSSGQPFKLSLIVTPDVGSYPTESCFMIVTNSDDIPDGVQAVLQSIADTSAGLTVPDLLNNISLFLQQHLTGESNNDPMIIDSEASDPDLHDYQSDSEQDFPDFGSDHDDVEADQPSETFNLGKDTAARINRRIKEDLRAVRFAGFKIGILKGMRAEWVNSFLSISIRVRKLGLSEEAIQAWDLLPDQYIILLIRYTKGYKDFETMINEPAQNHDMIFRIGVGNRYKPTLEEALAAFTDITETYLDQKTAVIPDTPTAGFSSMFIGSSLNDFTNSQFLSLLKIRYSVNVGWEGAKLFLNDRQGRIGSESADLPSEYFTEFHKPHTSFPDIVTSDHLSESQTQQFSLPLIATQFLLRYFTRCTEFCLVCHDRIKEEFEALKPYVCDKPLCLYQYMSLGFGPSVEHEILTQTYVVDLLVSFCYSSAMSRRLREYPVGMSLTVPQLAQGTGVTVADSGSIARFQATLVANANGATVATAQKQVVDAVDTVHNVKYDPSRQEVTFEENTKSPVRNGDWIILNDTEHFRVLDISYFPVVKLSDAPVIRQGQSSAFPNLANANFGTPVTPGMTPPPGSFIDARLAVYNQNFDEMDNVAKAETIVMLLETLPGMKEMKTYLQQQSRVSEPSLRSWRDRISPAALGILRWIIASNRSCIVQVDRCPGQDDVDIAASRINLEQRLTGVSDNWVQFRFAQGSPDKEQRFLNALKAQQSKFDARYPTIFAFHGSPLANWHSIIRSGLDFNETLHGRAYGHGVYHAMDQHTSIGYTRAGSGFWAGSDMKISSAMSLNEIVNCPDDYASSKPYLVVQHTDWIQCRYLLVQVQGGATDVRQLAEDVRNKLGAPLDPDNEVEQDPTRVAKSTGNKPIGVPLCAASISRAFRVHQGIEPSQKRRKSELQSSLLDDKSVSVSDVEDKEDLVFLLTDLEDSGLDKSKEKEVSAGLEMLGSAFTPNSFTDFVAGSLDQSKLPMLEPPAYATSIATKTLNRSLRELLEVQKKTPLHELGWYLDEQLISNVYQWIVELHSFDAELPLAKDMKAAGVTSIVLEIRFGKDYPFSPPFVRVIRPRFLPFTQGGGGHVTAGGAMCMELLTNSGWSSVSSIEGILLQVRLAMTNLEPRPARLIKNSRRANNDDYCTSEAMAAYVRACTMHGWEVPKDFQEFAGVGVSE